MGSRILVEDIEPIDELTERAKRAGLALAVYDHNKPKATTGRVVALGSDPLLHQELQVGDTVFFARYAGTLTNIDGKQYRTLEFQEITNILRELPDVPQRLINDPELETVSPPDEDETV